MKRKLKKDKLPKESVTEDEVQLTDRDFVSCSRFTPTARDKNRCHICLKPKSVHDHGEGIDE